MGKKKVTAEPIDPSLPKVQQKKVVNPDRPQYEVDIEALQKSVTNLEELDKKRRGCITVLLSNVESLQGQLKIASERIIKIGEVSGVKF